MTFRNEQGGITQGMAISLAIILFALMAGCIAIAVNDGDDEDGMPGIRPPGEVGGARTELASHRSRRCYDGYGYSSRRCGRDRHRRSGCVYRVQMGSIEFDFLCQYGSTYGMG